MCKKFHLINNIFLIIRVQRNHKQPVSTHRKPIHTDSTIGSHHLSNRHTALTRIYSVRETPIMHRIEAEQVTALALRAKTPGDTSIRADGTQSHAIAYKHKVMAELELLRDKQRRRIRVYFDLI